jgi:HrpA-like RNA helicase
LAIRSRVVWLRVPSPTVSPKSCKRSRAAASAKVRFSDHVSDNTMVKLMTDGILLAEIQQDRLLMQYDTIIIDEAHERSLNIDFLLGYLRNLLRRPDQVIITRRPSIRNASRATLTTRRLSKYPGALIR